MYYPSRVKTIRKTALFLGCVLIGMLILHYSLLSLETFSDFRAYYRAAERLLHGQNLYDLADGHYLFKYSPFAALLFAPLTLLPYAGAKVLWISLSWLLLFTCYVLTRKIEIPNRSLPLWGVFLIWLGISKFALAEIHLGQVDFLLLLFVLLSVISMGGRYETCGGIVLAFSVLFKPPLILMLVLPLRRRRMNFMLGFLLGLAGALLVPVFWYGAGTPELYGHWWEIMQVSSPDLLASEVNQSVFGALTRWLVENPQGKTLLPLPSVIPAIMGGILLVLFLAFVWLLDRSAAKADDPSQMERPFRSPAPALLLLASVVFSPLGWVQNYVFALPAISRAVDALAMEKFRNARRVVFLSLFFLFAVLPNFELLGRDLYNIYLGQSWIFLGVVSLMIAAAMPTRESYELR